MLQTAEPFLANFRGEAWKYTSLRLLSGLEFATPSAAAGALTRRVLEGLPDQPRLVFTGGRFQPDFSFHAPKLRVGHTVLFPQEAGGVLDAFNLEFTEDGADVALIENYDAGNLWLVNVTEPESHPVHLHPRHRIRLEPGARLNLIEISAGEGTYLHNPAFEIHLEKGAHLTHIRVQQESAAAFHLASVQAELDEHACYDAFTLTLGARLARAEMSVVLSGEKATAHLNAAQLLGGTQHGDFTTRVRHAAKCCASRQTVKNVLADRARGVFQGRIEVARGADKTDGYQMNQALLLSPDAEIDSKPELEIFADDVKCSHGATVGALDEDQLFYLQSRGIDRATALALLVRAFLSEALEQLTLPADSDIHAWLEFRIEAAFARLGSAS